MSQTKTIAVIGAGIAGLTCAYELQRAGFDVTVYEKNEQVGGRMATRIRNGMYFDIGADHLCDLYDHIKHYCKEFGIEWEKMRFLDYGIFRDGEVLPFGQTIGPFSRLKLMLQYSWTRRVPDFFNLEHSIDFDTENAYDYMTRRVSKEVADYLIDPFTSTYQFHRSKEISLGALIAIMDSLTHEKERWYLHRTKGGMSALPDALAKHLNVMRGMTVCRVVTGEDGIYLNYGKDETDQVEKTYDAVVIASPATVTAKIYKNPTPTQAAVLNETKYSSTISLSFKVPLEKMPNTGVVWVPYVENTAISGYVNESMKGEEAIVDGETMMNTWLHEEFALTLLDKSDDEIFERVKPELAKVCPWLKEVDLTPFDLERWPVAMPKFSHGHLKRVVEFLEQGQGEQNVYFCGDYLNAPWTEGALRCGQRVAQQIAARWTTSRPVLV